MTNSNIFDQNGILSAYLEAVEFTDFGEDYQPPHGSEFADQAKAQALKECTDFLKMCVSDGLLEVYLTKGGTIEQFGHDFWFTRNHHGVGFWDRDIGEIGEKLTKNAQKFGEVSAYLGDDSLVYFG